VLGDAVWGQGGLLRARLRGGRPAFGLARLRRRGRLRWLRPVLRVCGGFRPALPLREGVYGEQKRKRADECWGDAHSGSSGGRETQPWRRR
jgi:hypothetical protein